MLLTTRTDFAVAAASEEYGGLSQATLERRLALNRSDISGSSTGSKSATSSGERLIGPTGDATPSPHQEETPLVDCDFD